MRERCGREGGGRLGERVEKERWGRYMEEGCGSPVHVVCVADGGPVAQGDEALS